MLAMTQLIGFGTVAPPATVTYQSHSETSSGTTTRTFATQGIGGASSDRYVIVGVGARWTSGTPTINSMTIGGISATAISNQRVGSGTTLVGAALFIAPVPTGTTADIVVVFSASPVSGPYIVTWSATGLLSATATSSVMSNANPGTSGSFSVQEGGVIVAYATFIGNSAGQSTTWANLTERADNVIASWEVTSGASDAFANASTQTITATPSSISSGTMNFHCAAFR